MSLVNDLNSHSFIPLCEIKIYSVSLTNIHFKSISYNIINNKLSIIIIHLDKVFVLFNKIETKLRLLDRLGYVKIYRSFCIKNFGAKISHRFERKTFSFFVANIKCKDPVFQRRYAHTNITIPPYWFITDSRSIFTCK